MDPNKRPETMERITTPELANAFIEEQIEALRAQIGDGKGTWIVTEDLSSPALRRLIAPFLGEPGTVRLPFADREIVLRLTPDGNGFRVN